MDDYRESIWGIRPQDRKWFQAFTMLGGVAGSVVLAILELESTSTAVSPGEIARNLVVGIGASFVASGFVVWGALQGRELMSAMADWIREKTRKSREERLQRRERLIEEGRRLGREEGMRLGREEALREIYGPDYVDSQDGDHRQRSTGNDS